MSDTAVRVCHPEPLLRPERGLVEVDRPRAALHDEVGGDRRDALGAVVLSVLWHSCASLMVGVPSTVDLHAALARGSITLYWRADLVRSRVPRPSPVRATR